MPRSRSLTSRLKFPRIRRPRPSVSALLAATGAMVVGLAGSPSQAAPARPRVAGHIAIRPTVVSIVAVPQLRVASFTAVPALPPPPERGAAVLPHITTGQRVVDWALSQLGKPYLMGASGPGAYDCSGLALSAWSSVGVHLPRTAEEQYSAGTHYPLAQAQPGDLIFYGWSGGGIYHVAISLGGTMMVEAPHSGAFVQTVPITTDGTPLPLVTRPA